MGKYSRVYTEEEVQLIRTQYENEITDLQESIVAYAGCKLNDERMPNCDNCQHYHYETGLDDNDEWCDMSNDFNDHEPYIPCDDYLEIDSE